MTTTRRIDKTRKPPRRPPVRTAARTDDPAKSSETPAFEAAPTESLAAEPLLAGTSAVAMVAAEAPLAAPLVAETPDEAEQAGDAPPAESEASAEASAAGTEQGPVNEEPAEVPVTTAEAVSEEPELSAPSSEDVSVAAPIVQESPVVQESEASEPLESEASEPVVDAAAAETEQTPVQASGVQPPASAETAEPAAAPGPSGQEEVPLAAMQGFIEINGRLVAFFQGESQAALAFWKAALSARSPSDLAQLQAAEMNRAVEAALACWTDLAHRMGRLPAFTAPRARAA